MYVLGGVGICQFSLFIEVEIFLGLGMDDFQLYAGYFGCCEILKSF